MKLYPTQTKLKKNNGNIRISMFSSRGPACVRGIRAAVQNFGLGGGPRGYFKSILCQLKNRAREWGGKRRIVGEGRAGVPWKEWARGEVGGDREAGEV